VFLLVRTALPINGSIVIVLLPAVWNFLATFLICFNLIMVEIMATEPTEKHGKKQYPFE
jgi:hypothetical protein